MIEITGGVWSAKSIDEQSTMQLSRWSIWEIDRAGVVSRHFVGNNLLDYEGRVSSEIIDFDKTALRGCTNSGRVYELIGPPGYDENVNYVWKRWLRRYGEPPHREVTDIIFAGENLVRIIR